MFVTCSKIRRDKWGKMNDHRGYPKLTTLQNRQSTEETDIPARKLKQAQ